MAEFKNQIKKWSESGKAASIKAYITIGDDGAISSITYKPSAFAKFMNGREKNKETIFTGISMKIMLLNR